MHIAGPPHPQTHNCRSKQSRYLFFKSTYKWIHAVQTHSVQGSTVYIGWHTKSSDILNPSSSASKQVLSLVAQCWHRCRLSHKPETRSCPLLLSLTSTFCPPTCLSNPASHCLHLWPGATVSPSHCSSNRSTGQTEHRAQPPSPKSLNPSPALPRLRIFALPTGTSSHPRLHLARSLLISQLHSSLVSPGHTDHLSH